MQDASRAYGEANPAFQCSITGAVQAGDQVSVACDTTADESSPVGTYAITPSLSGAQAGNYTPAGSGTLTVVPAPLTIAADDFSRLIGAANPAFTGTILGLKNNDVVTASYATTATEASAVGKYAITPTAMAAASVLANYTVNAVNGTLYVVAGDIVPQTGWWWDATQPGAAVAIERQGGTLFMAEVAYTADGPPTWAFSIGPVSSSLYVGKAQMDRGGQTLTGPYQAPQPEGGAQQKLQLQFLDPANATLNWFGQTLNLQKFYFTGEGGLAAGGAIENGWWWNPTESGRGFAIEVQGTSLFMAGLMYDAAGAPVWFLADGTMTSPRQFSGQWTQYGHGPTLEGCLNPFFGGDCIATVSNPNVGSVQVTFSDASHGTMTLPDGRQIPIQRLAF